VCVGGGLVVISRVGGLVCGCGWVGWVLISRVGGCGWVGLLEEG